MDTKRTALIFLVLHLSVLLCNCGSNYVGNLKNVLWHFRRSCSNFVNRVVALVGDDYGVVLVF